MMTYLPNKSDTLTENPTVKESINNLQIHGTTESIASSNLISSSDLQLAYDNDYRNILCDLVAVVDDLVYRVPGRTNLYYYRCVATNYFIRAFTDDRLRAYLPFFYNRYQYGLRFRDHYLYTGFVEADLDPPICALLAAYVAITGKTF
ncbi:unnamed protein product [Rotaria sordida]|uniref:Uncharacterized protein n=1 Tax=Rotaria sordida TaxID=392033 RepID=A0A815H6I6_9BILA|nr:unnamed protein product [Rotaria sordida]CAF4051435.1 unnamed protein product [Rotaria sordida]